MGWLALVLAACGPADDAGPELPLPPRPAGAPGGAAIAREVAGLELAAREERILAEVDRGNVPAWMRRMRRVEMAGEAGGRERRIVFWATPDYLVVGSDDDFLRIPLSAGAAARVAARLGGSLPTARMVDAVWQGARMRLAPIRIRPDEDMATVGQFTRHDRLVASQRKLQRVPDGALIAGHKVDVVLPGALYGWHRPTGVPIQQIYPLEGEERIPYNRGVRVVDRRILVDGEPRDLLEALRDPELGPLLGAPGAGP